MTFDELRSTFEGLLKRRDLTTTQRDGWLNAAIDDVEDELQAVPPMEASVLVTLSAGANGILPIPSDYLQLKDITYADNALKVRDLDTVMNLRKCGVGAPTIFCRRGTNWYLAPIPADGDELQIDYYAEIPHLTNGTDTNWLSLVKPYAIIDGALVRAARHFVDRRQQAFEQAFANDIAQIQRRSDADNFVDAVVSPGVAYPCED